MAQLPSSTSKELYAGFFSVALAANQAATAATGANNRPNTQVFCVEEVISSARSLCVYPRSLITQASDKRHAPWHRTPLPESGEPEQQTRARRRRSPHLKQTCCFPGNDCGTQPTVAAKQGYHNTDNTTSHKARGYLVHTLGLQLLDGSVLGGAAHRDGGWLRGHTGHRPHGSGSSRGIKGGGRSGSRGRNQTDNHTDRDGKNRNTTQDLGHSPPLLVNSLVT